MKKLVLIIGLLAAVNISFGQERPDGPPPHERGMIKFEEYKDRLNLSDDQIDDLKSLKKKYHPEMEKIRTDEAMSRSDKMRAAADVMEKQEAEVAKILSEEQLTEWKAIHEEVKSKRMEERGKRKERRKGE